MTLDPVLATSAQAGAAVVVLLGAFAKMRRPAAFSQALAGYRLLPDALTAPVAFAIPLAEAIGAAALLFPDTRTAGAIGLVALLVAFAAAIAINLLRGHTDIDCGCSGFAAARTDAARHRLAARRARAAARRAGRDRARRAGARAVVWFDYLTLFFSVLLIVCALLTVDVLLANAPRLSHLRNS